MAAIEERLIRAWLKEAGEAFAGIEGHPDETEEYDRWSLKWSEDLLGIGQEAVRLLDAAQERISDLEDRLLLARSELARAGVVP